jgi:hypothetical protein
MPPKYYRNVRRRNNNQKAAPAGQVRTTPTTPNDGRKRPLDDADDKTSSPQRDNKKSKPSADAEPELVEFDNPWDSGISPLSLVHAADF